MSQVPFGFFAAVLCACIVNALVDRIVALAEREHYEVRYQQLVRRAAQQLAVEIDRTDELKTLLLMVQAEKMSYKINPSFTTKDVQSLETQRRSLDRIS